MNLDLIDAIFKEFRTVYEPLITDLFGYTFKVELTLNYDLASLETFIYGEDISFEVKEELDWILSNEFNFHGINYPLKINYKK